MKRFTIIWFIGLFFVLVSSNIVFAVESDNNEIDVPMTYLVNQPQNSDSEKSSLSPAINRAVSMKAYGVVMKGDLSLCDQDVRCEHVVSKLEKYIGVINACDNSPEIILSAFSDDEEKLKGNPEAFVKTLCNLIRTHSPIKRKQILHLASSSPYFKTFQRDMIYLESIALALQGSEQACVNFLKTQLGPYGPNWGYADYKALAGCSILSQQQNYEALEKDFVIWLKWGFCQDIKNPELRRACRAGATLSIDVEQEQALTPGPKY